MTVISLYSNGLTVTRSHNQYQQKPPRSKQGYKTWNLWSRRNRNCVFFCVKICNIGLKTQITTKSLMHKLRGNMEAFLSELHLFPALSPPSYTAVQEIIHPPSTAVTMATQRGKSILSPLSTPLSPSFCLVELGGALFWPRWCIIFKF